MKMLKIGYVTIAAHSSATDPGESQRKCSRPMIQRSGADTSLTSTPLCLIPSAAAWQTFLVRTPKHTNIVRRSPVSRQTTAFVLPAMSGLKVAPARRRIRLTTLPLQFRQ
jgi:hypothetical protein